MHEAQTPIRGSSLGSPFLALCPSAWGAGHGYLLAL